VISEPHLLFECVGLAERGGATLSQSDTLKCFDRDPWVAILHPNRKNVRERYTVAGVEGNKNIPDKSKSCKLLPPQWLFLPNYLTILFLRANISIELTRIARQLMKSVNEYNF